MSDNVVEVRIQPEEFRDAHSEEEREAVVIQAIEAAGCHWQEILGSPSVEEDGTIVYRVPPPKPHFRRQ